MLLGLASGLTESSEGFQISAVARSRRVIFLANLSSSNDDDVKVGGGVEEYRNTATRVLSNFMQREKMEEEQRNPIDDIDFNAPKIPPGTSLETLAAALDYELTEREWFVTGNVNPIYFSENFEFQDPDVKLKGIEEYARGVYKLFDQETSEAQIISTTVNEDASTPERPVITCRWRLSGGVSIGPGLTIKPYIVNTDFAVDPSTSLIIFQEDRFDLPGWDILLSSLFPFLIGKITAEPVPPVPKRELKMPRIGANPTGGTATSPLDSLAKMLDRFSLDKL